MSKQQNVDTYLRDLAYEVLNPFSRDFLERSGISPGMSVLDVGCGPGIMTSWLANTVGPEGHVVALDVSASALESAQNRIRSEGLTNVDFILESVRNVGSIGRRFDLIYGRFILMQLPDPFEVLESLVCRLRPKGILAMDEPNQEADFAVPPCPPCAQANRVFMEFSDRVGLSFRIGDSLFPMFRRLGCEILVARAHQPIVTMHPALQMFKNGLLDSAASLIDASYRNSPKNPRVNSLPPLGTRCFRSNFQIWRYAMTNLRQRMIEDLQLRGIGPLTQQRYVRAVQQLAEHYRKSPDLI